MIQENVIFDPIKWKTWSTWKWNETRWKTWSTKKRNTWSTWKWTTWFKTNGRLDPRKWKTWSLIQTWCCRQSIKFVLFGFFLNIIIVLLSFLLWPISFVSHMYSFVSSSLPSLCMCCSFICHAVMPDKKETEHKNRNYDLCSYLIFSLFCI